VENEYSDQIETVNKMLYLLHKEILTFEEACIYLGRKASFMYKLTSGRLIPHYVPNGKLIYFKRTELDEWVLQHKRKSLEEVKDEAHFLLTGNEKGSKNQF
jgi:excisionase family DNA binding protein